MAQWGLVNQLALKRFNDASVADEAALYVLDSLARNNWQRLRQFRGKSRFTTFLSSVVFRLLEDFARKKFGRLAPPKWIREAGGIWLILFRLLCLERFSFNEAVHLAADRASGIQVDQLEQAAETILGEIPHCGKKQQEVEFKEEQVTVKNRDASGHEQLETRERELLLSAIAHEIFGESIDSGREHALVRVLGEKIELQGEEKLLLKLCFREGFSVTKAGAMIGLNRFQAHGRMRRLLERIRRHFEDAGCEEEIRQLLT